MKKTTTTTTNAKTADVVSAIRNLTARGKLDRKTHKAYYDGAKEILNTCFAVYRARENGTSTVEMESKAMTEVTAFLHTLGKVNGKFISVCEKTAENGITSVLFDSLVYNSFDDSIICVSDDLAKALCEKATASKEKAKTHKALVDGKGTAKAYKDACKVYDEKCEAVAKLQEKQGKEKAIVKIAKDGKFTAFLTARLRQIIENRFAMTSEEVEAMRKVRNKTTKAKRSEAKKTEAKKTA